MKRANKTLTIVLCFVLVISSVFALSACQDDVTPPEPPHTHEFRVYEIRSDCHITRCICGEGQEGEHVYDSDGVCTTCGAKNHEHVYDRYAICPYELDYHWIVCECGVIQVEQAVNEGFIFVRFEEHDFSSGTTCSKCGATKHEHTLVYVGERNELYHYVACGECGTWISQAHDCTSEHACTVCGYTLHEHQWKAVEAVTFDEHVVQCTVCGLTDLQTHEFSDGRCNECGATEHIHRWVWTGEYHVNIHYLKCEDCGWYTWEEHVFEDGSDVCSVCGQPPHEHNFEFVPTSTSNETQHRLYCEDCGNSEWQDHIYGDDDVCDVCGYDRTQH